MGYFRILSLILKQRTREWTVTIACLIPRDMGKEKVRRKVKEKMSKWIHGNQTKWINSKEGDKENEQINKKVSMCYFLNSRIQNKEKVTRGGTLLRNPNNPVLRVWKWSVISISQNEIKKHKLKEQFNPHYKLSTEFIYE